MTKTPWCELKYRGCTNDAQLVEDPYEADVNNNPGVMVWACENCIRELHSVQLIED